MIGEDGWVKLGLGQGGLTLPDEEEEEGEMSR